MSATILTVPEFKRLNSAVEIAMSRQIVQHAIPRMTHYLSKHWPQPDPSEIEVDDTHALMMRATFEKLLDYSRSQPTGVYAGKMWRAYYKLDGWMLHWWIDIDAETCRRCNRRILIAEDPAPYFYEI